jgi:hypothetical protein
VLVAIELPPEDTAAAAIVVGACSEALASGECAVATPAAEAAVRARVMWDGAEHRHAFVWVESTAGGHDGAQRWLSFAETDSAEQRWRSVGFVVGTLAGDIAAAPPPKPPPLPSPRPPTVAPPPWPAPVSPATGPSPPAEEPRLPGVGWAGLGLDARAHAAWESADGAARAGVGLGLLVALGTDSLFASAGFRYLAAIGAPGALDVAWLGGEAGLGLRVSLDPHLTLEATAAFALERLVASAFDPETGITGETGRTLPGGRLAVDVVAGVPGLAFVGGVEGAAMGGTTYVLLRGAPAMTISPLGVGLHGGLRVGVPIF